MDKIPLADCTIKYMPSLQQEIKALQTYEIPMHYGFGEYQPLPMYYGFGEYQPLSMYYGFEEQQLLSMHYGFEEQEPLPIHYEFGEQQPLSMHYGFEEQQPLSMHSGFGELQPLPMHYGFEEQQPLPMHYGFGEPPLSMSIHGMPCPNLYYQPYLGYSEMPMLNPTSALDILGKSIMIPQTEIVPDFDPMIQAIPIASDHFDELFPMIQGLAPRVPG